MFDFFSNCKYIKGFTLTLVVVFISSCSMATKKSRLDKFLDGDKPETTVVVKSRHSDSSDVMDSDGSHKTVMRGGLQLTSLKVANGNGQGTESDIVVGQNNRSFKNNSLNTQTTSSRTNAAHANEAHTNEAHTNGVATVDSQADSIRCNADDNPSFSYRKRVGVLPMELQQRLDVVDAPFIERQYSQELVRRMRSDALLPVDASHQYVGGGLAMRELLSPEQARALAKQLGVQFVVSGSLVDLSFEQTKTYAIDLALSTQAWKNFARETYRRATDSQWRELNVEIAVYDGPSGALIKQDIYKGGANQRINTDSYSGLDSNRFWQSDYGQLLSKVLNDQVQMVERSIECLPMRAQVVSASDDHIEINAGVDTLLMPGDKLKLFHRAPTGQVRDNENAYRWQYFGEVTVAGVFPFKAVAVLDDNLPRDMIKAGDIVQAW